MTNADKFKNIFGLYATELWSMPEKDFLKWLNSEAMNCSEFPNNSDTISRQSAIDRATKEHDFFRGAVTVSDKARRDELLNVMCWLGELPPAQPAPSQVAADIARIVENGQDMRVIGQERIRGRWIIRETSSGDTEARCSHCGFTTLVDEPGNGLHMVSDLNFCPNCGAEMRGEQDG